MSLQPCTCQTGALQLGYTPSPLSPWFFETGSCLVAQDNRKLRTFLLYPPRQLNHKSSSYYLVKKKKKKQKNVPDIPCTPLRIRKPNMYAKLINSNVQFTYIRSQDIYLQKTNKVQIFNSGVFDEFSLVGVTFYQTV